MNGRDARELGICARCGALPLLARRKDGTGVRALYWCFDCCAPAYYGASFVRVATEALDTLPIVEEDDRQGRLF